MTQIVVDPPSTNINTTNKSDVDSSEAFKKNKKEIEAFFSSTQNTNNSDLTADDSSDRTRDHWGNKFEFILACIGYSVGLG